MTRYGPGQPFRLRIDSSFEKPAWKARLPGDSVRPPFPGTPLRFEGRYYEIVRTEVTPGKMPRYCYYLNHWDDGHPLRHPQDYTSQGCEKALADFKDQQRRQRHSTLLNLLSPLVGLLPAHDQRRLENEYPISALGATIASTILLWIPSTVIIALSLALQFGPGFGAHGGQLKWISPLAPFAWYFFIECLLRFASAMKLGEPLGSLPVFLPLETYRALRRAVDPEARRASARRAAIDGRGAEFFAEARDEVRTLEDAPNQLEILSYLPKPHWTANQTGVRYGETIYLLIDRGTLRRGQDELHRFQLEEANEEVFFRSVCDYHPEEVQDLYRKRRRAERLTWVETLAPIWGFLDPRALEQLQGIYEVDPRNLARHSQVVGFALAILCLGWSFGYVLTGTGRVWDALIFLLGVYLLAETAWRRQKLSAGQICGSLFGRLLKPLATRLLE